MRRSRPGRTRRVLILLENLPLEKDPRVRRECAALLEAGYAVSVICPRGSLPVVRGLEHVRLHTYPPPPEARGPWGFVYEFAYSWLRTVLLTLQVAVTEGFDVIQGCNPPDTAFAIAWPYRLLGRPFVFDHHDLSPEMFTARYGRTSGPVLKALLLLEQATYRTADHVIATNEAFRRIALDRGRKRPEQVTVVRNGPDLAKAHRREAQPQLRHGRKHLCCWLGLMFPDDGVELAVEAVANLVHVRGRRDCHVAFVGDGEKRAAVQALASRLGLDDWVSFPGWIPLEEAFDYLSTADLGLSPNPKTPRLDVSTSMKVMEYMAFELPVVAFDVAETRHSAGAAAAYAVGNDPAEYARLIDQLLDDSSSRARMGRKGRARVEGGLAWDHQKVAYVQLYDDLLRPASSRPGGATGRDSAPDR